MATFSTASLHRGHEMTEQFADQDYYLDNEGNVTADTETAATLLVRKGQELSREVADQIGKGKPAKAVSDDEGEKASSPKSNKAESPKQNKGAK